MKIITGIGRCGTSALALYCKETGLNVGEVRWIDRYDAGMEDMETIKINETLIKEGESPFVNDKIEYLERDVVKDPRFLADHNLIRHWYGIRKDIKVFWLRRNPKEIVASQKRKASMNCPAYRCFEDLIIEKEKSFENVLKTDNIPYIELWFPDFLYQGRQIIAEFGGSMKLWNQVIKT